MQRTARSLCLAAVMLIAASCNRGKNDAPHPDTQPLAAYATQRVVLLPTSHVRAADSLGWVGKLGGARTIARRLDTAIVAQLDTVGIVRRWILPVDLVRAYERNRTYASDPYELTTTEPRAPKFITGSRYGEPLASQLRTMIALHEDARWVLMPIELRFEKAGQAQRAILRAAILDPRLVTARWVGDVKGDAYSEGSAALGSVAGKLAELFAAR